MSFRPVEYTWQTPMPNVNSHTSIKDLQQLLKAKEAELERITKPLSFFKKVIGTKPTDNTTKISGLNTDIITLKERINELEIDSDVAGRAGERKIEAEKRKYPLTTPEEGKCYELFDIEYRPGAEKIIYIGKFLNTVDKGISGSRNNYGTKDVQCIFENRNLMFNVRGDYPSKIIPKFHIKETPCITTVNDKTKGGRRTRTRRRVNQSKKRVKVNKK